MLTTVDVGKETTTMPRIRSEALNVAAIEIVAGLKLRSGVPVVTGFIKAGALIDNYDIPTYDARTRQGYQRPLQESRVNELATDLRKERVDLPTAILLNVRNRDARRAIKDGQLDLSQLRDGTSAKVLLHVVDGQHRVEALRKLIDEDPKWEDYTIPFICMVGATEAEEMEQFYVVNSRAKSVRTDLALVLLRTITDQDPKMLERLQEKGREWQVTAEKIVETLAEDSLVWRGLIRLPAVDKGLTTMPSASMVASLKPLLGTALFARLKFEQQQQVIEAYWTGIREAMRPPFDAPQKYVIQKGVGVMVLHTILVDVMEIARSSGQSLLDTETYRNIMQRPLEELQGEAQGGTPVTGAEFWRTAPDGAAGTYSSSAGRRLLISKIRQSLPRVEVI